MFAVMILAFGVIMIAIMIPVAIRQTQETRETNAGSAVVETGFHDIETMWSSLPDSSTVPPRPNKGLLFTTPVNPQSAMPSTRDPATNLPLVVSFPSHAWNHAFASYPTPADLWPNLLHYLTLGNRVSSSDARLAYIPFYSRDGTLAPQIAFVGVRARNIPELAVPGAGAGAYLERGALFGFRNTSADADFEVSDNAPLLIDVLIESSATVSADGTQAEKIEPDRVQIYLPGSRTDPPVAFPLPPGTLELPADYETRIEQALVEGAALVLVNDRGQIRILTLGPHDPSGDEFAWQLAPGGDVHARIANDVNGNPIVRSDFNDPDRPSPPAPYYRGYLVGRMLKDPSRSWQPDTSTDPPPNPYVGPSQVVQVLEGKLLR